MPNVYVIHNECFVVMFSSYWNNTTRSNCFQIFMSNLCSSATWCYVIWQHFATNFSETTRYFKKLVLTVCTKLHSDRCEKIVIFILTTVIHFVLLYRLLLPSASLNTKQKLYLIYSTQIRIYDKFNYCKLVSNIDSHVNFVMNNVSHWT
jgi:hypothetical protein